MIRIFPSKRKFIENAKSGRITPVYAELSYIPPQQIYETIETPFSFLLESIKGPEKIARYSFLGAEPFVIFKVKNSAVEIADRRQIISPCPIGTNRFRPLRKGDEGGISPLKKLKEILTTYKIESQTILPPFIGGAVGMISYDFVHYFESLPNTAIDDLDIPDAHFMIIDTVIALDHKLQKTFLISCPAAEETITGNNIPTENWDIYYDRACKKIINLYKKITSTSPLIINPRPTLNKTQFRAFPPPQKVALPKRGVKPSQPIGVNSLNRVLPTYRDSGGLALNQKGHVKINHEMGRKNYMNIVKKTKDYIRAGDIFQANLSQRVSANIGNAHPWQIYKVLSRINPSPFAGYLHMGAYYIASSSPERLVKVFGNKVETRPIAGTRPRGKDAEGDRWMRTDLLLNEKERAEHLMLIDLERNDLGKISDYSTVEVDEFMITEDYSHVIHIVSNIKGTIVKGKDCFDAIRATFPGGTITGVPKVRCMEIIDELEPVVRGPYTGSIGYIGFNGAMDLNIIIRTFIIKDSIAYVQAGAGIVADSDPEREYYETLKKAEALIKTLEVM